MGVEECRGRGHPHFGFDLGEVSNQRGTHPGGRHCYPGDLDNARYPSCPNFYRGIVVVVAVVGPFFFVTRPKWRFHRHLDPLGDLSHLPGRGRT